MLFCVFRQELAPPLADVALRHVDDAQEREVIAVGEQTQVRERVLDLAPREELDATVDGIGNLRFEELFLDAARDVMRAVEHRHLAISDALCVKPCHLASQPAGLLARRACMMADDLPAMLFHGHEILLDAARVLGDQRIDDREDFRRRTVVLEHEDGLRAREVGIEVQEIASRGPAPRVDGLVGVADDEEVLVPAAEHVHEPVLRLVDVLELVNHDVLEALLPLLADRLVLGKDVQRELDEVVVVEPEALLLFI